MNVRRVVTTNDGEGKSFVKWDSKVKAIPGRPGFVRFPLWATKTLPAELTEEDPGEWELGTTIGGGSVFRLNRYDPGVTERWHQ
ncbi:hypothetical protein ACFLW5_02535, partial [Chloroflexota bacterium]